MFYTLEDNTQLFPFAETGALFLLIAEFIVDAVHARLLVRDDQLRIEDRHLCAAKTGAHGAPEIMRFPWLDRTNRRDR